MIFPMPEDLRGYQKYPLTWMAVFLNCLLFFLIFSSQRENNFEERLFNDSYLEVAGGLYFQHLGRLSPEQLATHPDWVHSLKMNTSDQRQLLGLYALRDQKFLEKAAIESGYKGDVVAIQDWQMAVGHFLKAKKNEVLFKFGLSADQTAPLRWITYQFSHSNAVHLISNLAFLLVMGVAVEALVGSTFFLGVYFLGGLVGGAVFILLNQHGSTPMVGASASISALLAFYCLAETRLRVRYFYFVSPMEGHYGWIYLPTLLMVPLFLVVDFSSLISTPDGLGSSVAYSAHIGGTLTGLFLGGLYRFLKMRGLIHIRP